jgi:hypothetical protein
MLAIESVIHVQLGNLSFDDKIIRRTANINIKTTKFKPSFKDEKRYKLNSKYHNHWLSMVA